MSLPLSSRPSSLDMFPALGALELTQCEDLLKRNTVGRLASSLQDHVSIVPIHYVYEEGWIYCRTEAGGKLDQILRNRRVAFEVDEQQGMFSWQSVIVHGPLYLIELDGTEKAKLAYEQAVRALRRILPSTLGKSDPVPFRNHVFQIQATEISGRFATLGGRKVEPSTVRTRDNAAQPDADEMLRASAIGAVSRVLRSASQVHVDAFDGIVVLTGKVETTGDRSEIEREILALTEVVAVVQQLETSFPPRQHPTPADIARDAIQALKGCDQSVLRNVKLVVEHDWLRAEGWTSTTENKIQIIRSLATVRGTRGVIDRLAARS
jgi:uncharacterized protein